MLYLLPCTGEKAPVKEYDRLGDFKDILHKIEISNFQAKN